MRYEIAARAVARQWAIAEGKNGKDQDRYVEEYYSLAWLAVCNSMLTELGHAR